jgi:ABC-type multidrug transport system ATPase subunit
MTGDEEARIRYYGGEMTLPGSVPVRRWASLFNLPIDDRRPIGRLSRGGRQMLGLRVLLSGDDAELLLLDEPWEGLDPEGSAWLTDTVRQWTSRGAALLISSHRLYDLDSVCSRFLLLDGGRCHAVADRELGSRVDQLAQAVRWRAQRGRA